MAVLRVVRDLVMVMTFLVGHLVVTGRWFVQLVRRLLCFALFLLCRGWFCCGLQSSLPTFDVVSGSYVWGVHMAYELGWVINRGAWLHSVYVKFPPVSHGVPVQLVVCGY